MSAPQAAPPHSAHQFMGETVHDGSLATIGIVYFLAVNALHSKYNIFF